MRQPFPSRRDRRRSRGQSMVEMAIVVPVLLLLTLTAIDFGRVFLGWVNLQQMTRIAANHAAEHVSAWGTPGDPAEQARYQTKVQNDARAINCDLPTTLPPPQISGTALGSHVRVAIDCEFSIITPIISSILGGTILVSAETTYPVKEGAVAIVPGGGSPIVTPPDADFVGSPQSGWGSSLTATAPLEVTFVDLSTGGAAAWTWNFSAGTPSGSGASSVSRNTALAQGPHTVLYDCAGVPGDECIFNVSLSVSNAGGADSLVKSSYIRVTVPPESGPIAEFTGTPRSGIKPLTVTFRFVDLRGGTVIYTRYEWDLNGDGNFSDASGPTVAFNYTAEGSYDVSLRVTDNAGGTSTLTKDGYINVVRQICIVPDFANVNKNQAQQRWTNANFTTTVLYAGGNWNKIRNQSIIGGTIDPQPDGCDSVITVGP